MTISTGSEKPQLHIKLFGLDFLRAAAIILVFLFHYGRLFPHPEWTYEISKFGWSGVDLFFVLSGYLISSQLFVKISSDKKISFKEFFIKRFFRIIPAYLAVVFIYFSFPSFREHEALAPLWKYLTFTQNIGLDLRSQGTFSHAWSLCIEEQFYLCLPLILIAMAYFKAIKKGFIILIFFFLFCFFARLYSWHSFVAPFAEQDEYSFLWLKFIYYPTYCRLDGLLIGVSIAALFQFKPSLKERLQKHGNVILLMSLLVLTGAYFLCSNQESFSASIFGFPLTDFGYGLLVLAAICPTCILYKIKSAFITKIAVLSYATYLSHKIIIHITQTQFSKLNINIEGNFMFFICIATSLTAALLMNKIIEKPFLKLRDKILQKKNKNKYE
jgi:peptidoglycan/LPS O-acetylase OafA/YrhL